MLVCAALERIIRSVNFVFVTWIINEDGEMMFPVVMGTISKYTIDETSNLISKENFTNYIIYFIPFIIIMLHLLNKEYGKRRSRSFDNFPPVIGTLL